MYIVTISIQVFICCPSIAVGPASLLVTFVACALLALDFVAGRERLGGLIEQVNLAEHEADLVESRAAGFVFTTGEEDALAAVHMYRVLQRLDDVANACETAANGYLSLVHN